MHPNIGKSSRIDTLFNSNDNAFVVAFDHGILMGPIDGIKDIESSVSRVVQGGPDAIQVTPPIAKVVSENFLGRNSPSLLLDWTLQIYGDHLQNPSQVITLTCFL